MPCKQYNLIGKDKLSIASYVARTLDGVAQNSHLRSDNYFYFNCLTGRCVPHRRRCRASIHRPDSTVR